MYQIFKLSFWHHPLTKTSFQVVTFRENLWKGKDLNRFSTLCAQHLGKRGNSCLWFDWQSGSIFDIYIGFFSSRKSWKGFANSYLNPLHGSKMPNCHQIVSAQILLILLPISFPQNVTPELQAFNLQGGMREAPHVDVVKPNYCTCCNTVGLYGYNKFHVYPTITVTQCHLASHGKDDLTEASFFVKGDGWTILFRNDGYNWPKAVQCLHEPGCGPCTQDSYNTTRLVKIAILQ